MNTAAALTTATTRTQVYAIAKEAGVTLTAEIKKQLTIGGLKDFIRKALRPVLAYEMEEGMTILVNGSEAVTVAKVTRRDPGYVTNGVVHFTATNGRRYGLTRYENLRFA